MKKNSIGFREPEHGAIDVNILICAFPPALHPSGQPSVARPTGFPALRFPAGQFRMEPRAERNQRPHPPPHLDLPRSGLINPLSIFNSVVMIRAFPRRLTLRSACGSLPSGCPAA